MAFFSGLHHFLQFEDFWLSLLIFFLPWPPFPSLVMKIFGHGGIRLWSNSFPVGTVLVGRSMFFSFLFFSLGSAKFPEFRSCSLTVSVISAEVVVIKKLSPTHRPSFWLELTSASWRFLAPHCVPQIGGHVLHTGQFFSNSLVNIMQFEDICSHQFSSTPFYCCLDKV